MTDELYDPRLLVRGMYRIYCVGWNGMYWLNSRNWIRASLELAFGGRWWHVSTWQWMALATSFQDRGGKVGKLTKQFWWNLGVQPETKILSESIVSVERFDYSGYQCRFNRRHAQYNKHILLIYHYIYIFILRSSADRVANNLVIPPFHHLHPRCKLSGKHLSRCCLQTSKRRRKICDKKGWICIRHFTTPSDGSFFFPKR